MPTDLVAAASARPKTRERLRHARLWWMNPAMPEDEARESADGAEETAEEAAEESAPAKPSSEPSTPGETPPEGADEPIETDAAAPSKKKKTKRPGQARKRKPPPTEAQIDSPDRRALALLLVVFAVTAGSVGSARLACNYHPPESHSPPILSTDKLAKTPKDAAIELAQRWATKNYDLARELAKGSLLGQIEAEAKQCEANASQCASERKRLAKEVVTSAVLLESGADAAMARVTSAIAGKVSHYRLELVRDGAIWKGTARHSEP
jgi:hypothetical protein